MVGVEYIRVRGLDVLTVERSGDHVLELGLLQRLTSFFMPLLTFFESPTAFVTSRD